MKDIVISNRQSALKSLDRRLKKMNADHSRKIFILTDENVLQHCLPLLVYNTPELEDAEFLELPAGEACKDIIIVEEVWKALMASCANRDAIIVNLGGGCVCDTGGFIAATYKRGIDFINIPTTLIGMVDAAIGGKTAINLDSIKNPIGCFYYPIMTCIEPAFLDTLPDEELRSGEYEIMKVLLLTGYKNWHKVFVKETDYKKLITYCIDFKQSVVKTDPKECGIRKMLNLGHTIGHALEAYNLKNGTKVCHGEAIGIGILYALYLSSKKLGFDEEWLTQYKSWLTSRIAIPQLTLKEIEKLLEYVHLDKKNLHDETRCVLLKAPGEPVIDVTITDNEIRDALLSIGKK